jgi:hypothetical protein
MIDTSLQPGDTMTLPARPFARVARSVAGYGVATALMLVSPLFVFAPASLFHCAMRNGRVAAWLAGFVSLVLAGLYFLQAGSSAGTDANTVYTSFVLIALAIAVPSMIVVPLVDRREKFGTVLATAVVASSVGVLLTELIMRAVSYSPYAVQLAEQTAFAMKKADEYRPLVSQSFLGRIGLWLLTHSPQVVAAGIVLNFALFFVLSLMMYGRLSAWRAFAASRVADPETRRTYLFRNLALPEWMLFVFVIGGLTPLLTGPWQKVAANVLAVMVCLYMLQGVAVLRAMLVRAGAGFIGGAFGLLLLAMLCLTGIGLLPLMLTGLFDTFFDFRHLKRKDDSHESHTD